MKNNRYVKPELQAEYLELRDLLAESDDYIGGDMPIDDVELTF